MYRTAIRSAARPVARSLRAPTKRFASTASPADRPRSWKGSALRWGLAGAALYYYNTSPVFADEAISRTVAAPPTFADDELPTVDSVIEEKRKQVQQKTKTEKKAEAPAAAPNTADAKAATEAATDKASQAVAVEEDAGATEGGIGALEEEAGQQGAFNPETGEINWDCPCLGGMAHGPCGEEFKTAFSCFVYSTEEPKGMDCIEKFQGMQECFRKYPEVYGAELAEEEAALQEDQAEAPVAAVPEDLSSQKVQDAIPATHDATAATDPKPADAEVSAPAADVKVASPEAKEEPKQEEKKE